MEMPSMYSPYGGTPSQVSPMSQEPMGYDHKKQMMEMCKKYHHHLMQMEGTDGRMYEGIIDGMDDDHVYLLVPVGDMDDRAFGSPYGGHPYYGGFGYGYGYPRRFRRFIRRPYPFFFFRRFFFPFFF